VRRNAGKGGKKERIKEGMEGVKGGQGFGKEGGREGKGIEESDGYPGRGGTAGYGASWRQKGSRHPWTRDQLFGESLTKRPSFFSMGIGQANV
jgi:hypothetical protein